MATNTFDRSVGLLKKGSVSLKPSNNRNKIYVEIPEGNSKSSKIPKEIYLPVSLINNNGIFIGTLPEPGTPIIVGQGDGNEHHFVSFYAEDRNKIPNLHLGELLICSNNKTRIILNDTNDINIGSVTNRLYINSVTNLLASNFDNNYNFTQASRYVNGIVKRDIISNEQIPQSSKLDEDYKNLFLSIGLDPTVAIDPVSRPSKNPPFVEQRELIYEFQYSSNVTDDLYESSLYSGDQLIVQDNNNFINRRESRADTLSLTLAEPNYLMEIIKGTVIDIYGNILDLNRAALPIGENCDQNTLNSEKSKDKVESYRKIREIERKSLAFHFEINARKDLFSNKYVLPDINSKDDYARNRSRFFIDIDKEGQFKLNIPSSSEKGNIALLTRYENFCSFNPEGPNAKALMLNEEYLDIYQDSFATIKDRYPNDGYISILDGDAEGAPTDRITKENIRHGTAYHNILNTCYMHINQAFNCGQYEVYKGEPGFIDIEDISTKNRNSLGDNLLNKTINISGDNANAGGRSGSINLDGSLELNIGANSIDRQSLWLDFAGGIIANIGRDKKNKSLAMNMDGDVFIQLGGYTVNNDSRFITGINEIDNSFYGATLELRVMTQGINNQGNYVTMIRISNDGIQITTPSNINIHSGQCLNLTANSKINIDCPELILQGRTVVRGPSIGSM